MQTPPLRKGHLYIKNLECAESNEKSCAIFFRFVVFELLAAKELPIRLQIKNYTKVAKFTEKIGIDLTTIFRTIDIFFAIISF